MDLSKLTIESAHKLLTGGEISAVELTTQYLAQIDSKNKELNAFLSVKAEKALVEAKEADVRIKNDQAGYLTGIPLAVKDNILVKDDICTAGSKILENYKASYDATVINRLKREGAVILGKTNLDEFAMGSSTENSAYGPTNGGSSGGSAAAVAADMCLGALGTDTGGSIRQPAGFCGVVGLKPTYGAVSRFGAVALGSSLDQVGPLAKTVKDAALIYETISGHDPLDSTTLPSRERALNNIDEINISDLKIGWPKEYFETDGLDSEVKNMVMKAINWFESQGAEVKEISLPHTRYSLATYYIIQPAECSANLARYDGIRYGQRSESDNLLSLYTQSRGKFLGSEVQRRIMTGTYTLSAGYYEAYYTQAQKIRALIKQDFINAFEEVDVIMAPVSPDVAFKLGEKTNDPLKMYAADIFTVTANLAGVCGLALNCGKINGLPVGLQILGPWFGESLLFKIGEFYEQGN
ncbi:MAG: Asp-tRNA(Asn)/Glu-tRNA(Gln) amidotransferase subunit GatA [Candidatus Sungbacteria bacterium]|uniref:Glutamyl-tRNA(Gln) amidotransferase subunit A n=1 Tax=Candidatus Sungiibacteriota bacterium TaxID=2750080 RepID=A0A931YDH8_9BACT|nr:Asp-tRNA(Asn)/Glu-tRNA(Gln) amidotransferase subunit GatA [Candidatus Sungbacteria bacterium]